MAASGVPCQLGGGLRSEAHLAEALSWGVQRVILGTRALQDPAPFAAGAAARRSADLDTSRQERALLGALIERPALLHILAEELAHLPIGHEELQRLRSGLLDALSLVPSGIEPAADEAQAVTALGHWVHVYVDRTNRKPVPIPDAIRSLLSTAQLDR